MKLLIKKLMEKSIEYFRKGVINLQDKCVYCGWEKKEGQLG